AAVPHPRKLRPALTGRPEGAVRRDPGPDEARGPAGRRELGGCEEVEAPVVAAHGAALWIFEVVWPLQLEAELAAEGVRRGIVNRGKGRGVRALPPRPPLRDRRESGRSRAPPPLEGRQHRPPVFVALLPPPVALPVADPADSFAGSVVDDLELPGARSRVS